MIAALPATANSQNETTTSTQRTRGDKTRGPSQLTLISAFHLRAFILVFRFSTKTSAPQPRCWVSEWTAFSFQSGRVDGVIDLPTEEGKEQNKSPGCWAIKNKGVKSICPLDIWLIEE